MRRLAGTVLFTISLSGALAAGAGRPLAAIPISASAPLGSVTTAWLTLGNSADIPITAGLYEALQPDTNVERPVPPPSSLRVPLPNAPGPIAADLLAEFAAAPDGQAEMLIYLSDQADLSEAAALADWNDRGRAVVETLRTHAADTQAPWLDALRNRGYAPRSFWIVNAIAVRGDEALAHWLAGQEAVGLVAANASHALEHSPVEDSSPGESAPAWGLARIGAPGVWEDWGVRGAGITVANLDTGVAYTHTTLLHNYRGWSAAGVDHNYNWFDAAGDVASPLPIDQAGHGTHTMGTLVGGPAGGYSALGVAPGARWIAVRACVGLACTDEALMAGAQWLLAPTDLAGNYPRPDLRPNIISNSWGKAGETDWYAGWVAAWNAAGMFSVFANGNYGGIGSCQSSTSPGGYAASFSAGATDGDDQIADFSSRGPTTDGRLKPDLSAPGVSVPSAFPDGSVKSLSGTSMAAPHIAGVAALLWSANPVLIGDLAATESILTRTATPRPTAECGDGSSVPVAPNNVYGWGRVDARQAVQQARVDVPWLSLPASVEIPANGSVQVPVTLDARQVSAPGAYHARVLVARGGSLGAIAVSFDVQPAAGTAQLTGHFSDLWHGAGVYGRLLVGAGPAVQTDTGGNYTVTLPSGAYVLTATASGYLSASTDISISTPLIASFVLTPDLPHLQWSAGPISATLAFAQQTSVPISLHNAGTRPLSITTEVPPLEWIVDSAGVAGPGLYDLSAMSPITLSDDSIYTLPLTLGFEVPIFGRLVSELYLSSNGWVSTVKPSYAAPLAICLPNVSLLAGSLAPFWADLDPSQGGRVRFGSVAPDIFVVSFEQVPPWREEPDPAGPTYTFQLVLHAGGQVDYLYGDMGPLPAQWSVGAAYDHIRGLRIGCHKTPVDLAHKSWTIHNQARPGDWLSAQPAGLTLAPGASANLYAVLSGFGFVPWHTGASNGILRLHTNDPAAPIVDVPASATVGPAPFSVTLLPVFR